MSHLPKHQTPRLAPSPAASMSTALALAADRTAIDAKLRRLAETLGRQAATRAGSLGATTVVAVAGREAVR